MSDILIKVIEGDYSNEDAYECVLYYISYKTYIGGCGFILDQSFPIVEQFHSSEVYSNHSSSQKMWHIVITFKDYREHLELLQIAYQAASLFAPDYQILYGLDTKGHSPHLHFGVNAFSYHPNTQILSAEILKGYLEHIEHYISIQYPSKTITMIFQWKKD